MSLFRQPYRGRRTGLYLEYYDPAARLPWLYNVVYAAICSNHRPSYSNTCSITAQAQATLDVFGLYLLISIYILAVAWPPSPMKSWITVVSRLVVRIGCRVSPHVHSTVSQLVHTWWGQPGALWHIHMRVRRKWIPTWNINWSQI